MLEELINMFPEFKEDILFFDDYIKNSNPEQYNMEVVEYGGKTD